VFPAWLEGLNAGEENYPFNPNVQGNDTGQAVGAADVGCGMPAYATFRANLFGVKFSVGVYKDEAGIIYLPENQYAKQWITGLKPVM